MNRDFFFIISPVDYQMKQKRMRGKGRQQYKSRRYYHDCVMLHAYYNILEFAEGETKLVGQIRETVTIIHHA